MRQDHLLRNILVSPPRPTFPFTTQWAISLREHWIWTDCGLLSEWQPSNRQLS